MPDGVSNTNRYSWEQAKRPSDSPRAAGALLGAHLRADEDLFERESELRAALERANAAGESREVCSTLHRLGLHLEAMGGLEAAEQALASAVATADGKSRSPEHAAVANDRAVVLARMGRHEEANESLARAECLGENEIAGHVQRNQGLLALVEGDLARSLDLWNAAFRTARNIDDPGANAQILNNVAVLRILEGEGDEAYQLLNRALLLAQRAGDIRGLAFTYNNLGLGFSGPPQGNHSAAIPFMEMALALLIGPVDILARLYVLNNNIIVYEQAHLEPARKFRSQFAATLKTFASSYPRRSSDIERSVFARPSEGLAATPEHDDEWEISAHPVLLRSCSRYGIHA